MTDTNTIDQFLSTPGMILQHCNKQEYLKNELGQCAIFATDHRQEKSAVSISLEKARDIMMLNRYVLPYSCNVDDPVAAIAADIKAMDDDNCNYIAEPGLVEYLTQ